MKTARFRRSSEPALECFIGSSFPVEYVMSPALARRGDEDNILTWGQLRRHLRDQAFVSEYFEFADRLAALVVKEQDWTKPVKSVARSKIGRASCRESVHNSVDAL